MLCGNLRVCENFRMQKRVVICLTLNYILSNKSNYGSLIFGLFPEDENSTRQTWRVTYDFHLRVSFDSRIGEWASAKGKLWAL